MSRSRMWYWREDYFETLKQTAAEAKGHPAWVDYATFCEKHEQGLRRDALLLVNRFIDRLEEEPFEGRKRFTSWLLNAAEDKPGRAVLIPYPLQRRIIEPTLLEWTLVEPACPEPHRWLGGYDDLNRAIELDPKDQIAIRRLLRIILGAVDYNVHELPAGYLGDPIKDIDALDRAEGLIGSLAKSDERQLFLADSAELRSAILSYLGR